MLLHLRFAALRTQADQHQVAGVEFEAVALTEDGAQLFDGL